jgi:cell division protein FtsQ
LQQVGKGSRFWWRALDAQSPKPIAPSTLRPRLANSLGRQNPQQLMPAPAAMFTLEIPSVDRRLRRTRKASRVKAAAFATTLLALITVVSAAVAVATPEQAWQDARTELRTLADEGLIAAGFGIDQVSLTGQRYTLDSDVFDALDLANVKTFAALDTKAVLHRIERISWVESAQITRIYPGRLSIAIKERLPAAIWTRGDTSYLIDVTGRTLGPLPPAGGWALPRVSGEGANIDTPLLLTALERHSEIATQFNHAERVAERRWRIVLNNGTRIELAADRAVEGLDIVAGDVALRGALTGPPMVVDVRTPGRATIRPLKSRTALNGQTSPLAATVMQ